MAGLAALVVGAWLSGCASPLFAQNVDDGFDPDADGNVTTLAVQADGKLIVGGSFGAIAGQTRMHLARLLADGSVDPDFADTPVSGSVLAIAIQPDGKIVIGGSFSQVGAGGHENIARLNSDGSVDTGFDRAADDVVYALALQSNGSLLLGGSFTHVDGINHAHVARLKPDGSLDDAFNAFTDGDVRALTLESDGKPVLGGSFTMVGAASHSHIARLHVDGRVDAAFTASASAAVYALIRKIDGELVLGGDFTEVDSMPRGYLARLDSAGNLLGGSSFDEGVNGTVLALLQQADGKTLAGGSFSQAGTDARSRIVRFNASGGLDGTFDPSVTGNVFPNAIYTMAELPDGDLVFGGSVTGVNGMTRNHIARLSPDGSLDATLEADADASVEVTVPQPDGKLVLAGEFGSIDSQLYYNNIARLNADDSLDTAFEPEPNGNVWGTLVQPNGKLLVEGAFSSFSPNGGDTAYAYQVTRLNPDGTPDPGFVPLPSGYTSALVLQPDGKVVIGGNFTLNDGVVTRRYLVRLNHDGSVDMQFNPNVGGPVLTAALQYDGNLLIGGDFTSLAPNGGATVFRNHIARLSGNGSVDDTFDPNADDTVNTLSVQPDGKILIAGFFGSLAPNETGMVTRNYLARLNADGSLDAGFDPEPNLTVSTLAMRADGRIILGGSFSSLTPNSGDVVMRKSIARLNADGSLDSTFEADTNGEVLGMAVLPDGKLTVGGQFTEIGGQTHSNLARLSMPEVATQALILQAQSVVWLRSGASPELTLPPTLESSLDGSAYATLGTMQRVDGGWRLDFSPLIGQTFYLRAQGEIGTGEYNSAHGRTEFTRQFYIPDEIFGNDFD